jgi:hypothetical protein
MSIGCVGDLCCVHFLDDDHAIAEGADMTCKRRVRA